MTTSTLHLELLLGGRVGAPSTARSISHQPGTSEVPLEPNVMNPFARRPLGAPLTRADRAGILVMFAGLALILAGVLVG